MSVSPNCSRSRASAAFQCAGRQAPACSAYTTHSAIRAALSAACAADVPREQEADAGAQAEGKIKGPARHGLLGQSARGFGTARRMRPCVPFGSRCEAVSLAMFQCLCVPFSMHCDPVGRSHCNGLR